MLESYEEIVDSFDSVQYFGNVHVLETPNEGLCSFYYAELKPMLPKNKDVQFAVLWKLIELEEYGECYRNLSGDEFSEALTESFQYILDSWKPRPLEETDKSRARQIMLECQSSFPDGATRQGWGTNRQVGYYLNGKFRGSIFPKEIFDKINAAKSGLVISDEWNHFMLVLEIKNVYSLFYWSTGA